LCQVKKAFEMLHANKRHTNLVAFHGISEAMVTQLCRSHFCECACEFDLWNQRRRPKRVPRALCACCYFRLFTHCFLRGARAPLRVCNARIKPFWYRHEEALKLRDWYPRIHPPSHARRIYRLRLSTHKTQRNPWKRARINYTSSRINATRSEIKTHSSAAPAITPFAGLEMFSHPCMGLRHFTPHWANPLCEV